MESRFEIIDAFVDGERVDATALKLALSEPAGRDYLVDVWLLRESLQEEIAVSDEVPPAAAKVRARGARPWLMAAALAACLIGGYVTGHRTSETPVRPAPAAPPPPTTIPAQAPASFPAPVPTRVIQLQFGAGTQTSGGGE